MDKKRGFTLVELLVVVVVIAILAAISVVAYSGIQDRAKDAIMRTGISRVEQAIQIWYARYGEQPRGGWGTSTAIGSATNCAEGASSGWLASGTYACTLEDALRVTDLLPANFIADLPNNPDRSTTYQAGRYSVMLYPCSGGNPGRYALYYHLRKPTSEDSTQLAAAEASGCPTAPRSSYHMRAAKVITLN